MMIYVLDRKENIVLKGENASYQHFLLFTQCFHKLSMIVIATGFIPLSPLSVVLSMVMCESCQWLGKNIMRSTG